MCDETETQGKNQKRHFHFLSQNLLICNPKTAQPSYCKRCISKYCKSVMKFYLLLLIYSFIGVKIQS